jgi:hypothetical protein
MISVFVVTISFTACEEDDLTPNPVFDPDFDPDSARASNFSGLETVHFAYLNRPISSTITEEQ